MKLCINCKHFLLVTELCAASTKPDLVFGKHLFYFAGIEREGHTADSCGPDARHFEPVAEQAAA